MTMRRAVLAVLSVAAAATLLACNQTVTATVPVDCAGTPEAVTVEATMPQDVPSGAAFAMTVEVTGTDGVVALSLTDVSPALVAVRGTSTVQVVATGAPGSEVSIAVASVHIVVDGADDPEDPFDGPWQPITCTPTGPTAVGTITTSASTVPAEGATTPVDVSFLTWCTEQSPHPQPPSPAGVGASASVPTSVRPGQVLTLADLAVDAPSGAAYAVQVSGATTPVGPGYVSPSTPITVTAAAGGQVSLRFLGLVGNGGFSSCTPFGSGHLATIPVVAAPG
jgi:hypothetical protein